MPVGQNWSTRYGGHPVRVNNFGLRGPQIGRRLPGTPRVVFVGDSVTFGYGLPEESTYVHLLNGRRIGGSAPIETINAAIAGWSAREYRMFVERYAEALQPDAIIVGVVLNDLTELLNGRLETTGQSSISAINTLTLLARRSAAVSALKRLYIRVADPRGRELDSVRELAERPESRAVREAMASHLEELMQTYEFAAVRSIRFGLMLFPFAFQLDEPSLDAPQREMREFAERMGIAYLDLLEPLGGIPSKTLMLDDVHFSAAGNRLIADAVAAWLAEEGLVATSHEP